MQNLEIIILSLFLSGLFIFFIVSTIQELNKASKQGYKPQEQGGPRADLIKFVGSLFDEEVNRLPAVQKIELYKHVKRTIADMETDGVYFPEEVKEELEKYRQSMTCEYSGLPSMLVYLDEDKK